MDKAEELQQKVARLTDKLARCCALTWDYDDPAVLSKARMALLMRITNDSDEVIEVAVERYLHNRPSRTDTLSPDLEAIAEGL